MHFAFLRNLGFKWLFDGTSSCCWRSLALFCCKWFPIFHGIYLNSIYLPWLSYLLWLLDSRASQAIPLKKGRPFCLQKGGGLSCPSHDSKSDGEDVFMKGKIYLWRGKYIYEGNLYLWKGKYIYEGNLYLWRELVFLTGTCIYAGEDGRILSFGFWTLDRYVAILLVRPPLARILDLGFWILDHYVAVLFVRILHFRFWILGHVLDPT